MELAATINPSNAAESTLTATLPRLGPIQPAPTGTISFIDSNHGDALLGSAALGADSSVIGLGTLLGFSTNFDNIPFSAEGGLAIGDFNGDGIPDLAVSGEGFSSQQQSGIYLGKGDGTFTLDTAGPGLFSPILVADFNGDGNADILAGGSVFLGNGGGTFTTVTNNLPGNSSGYAVGDFNGDGIPDLAVATTTSSTSSPTTYLTAYLGKGDGTFTAAATFTVGSALDQYPSSIVTGDFNGDGNTDIAIGFSEPGGTSAVPIAIALGNGDGTFTAGQTPDITGVSISSIVVGDFNGDGHADLALAGSVGNGLQILLGNGNGAFSAAPVVSPAPVGSGGISLTIGDFNGDGIPDLAMVYYGTNAVYTTVNSNVLVYDGKGDGTFTEQTPSIVGYGSSSIAAGDFAGFGVSDLAIYNAQGSTYFSPHEDPPQFYNVTVSVLAPEFSQSATLANVSPTTPGSHLVQAQYAGNGLYGSAQSYTVSINGPAPTALTVTLHPAQRNYGAANPSFVATVTGLLNGNTVTVTPQTTATQSSPVGSYPIAATVTGADAANYTITVVPSTLVVSKAPLYISASNVAVTYGQTPPQPTAYTLTGFVNGDTASVVSGAPVLSTTVTSTTPVGFYKIGVAVGTLTAANYSFDTISNGEGAVGVYKADLQVIVNSLTMIQGGAVPALTYSITGFVNGDTAASAITGTPVLSTTATSSSAPGDYTITFNKGTMTAQNYAIPTGAGGILRVQP
jgi:hypothetical protein